MRRWCGISSMRILIISKGQLTSLIGNQSVERNPPWMNSFIKNLTRAKDNFYKNLFLKAVICIKNLQTHLNHLVG